MAPTPAAARCVGCHAPLGEGPGFRFQDLGGGVKCGACARRHVPMLQRSLVIALVVGTVLTMVNQGDALLRGEWGRALLWKLPLTYFVPFVVATWSALANTRVR